VFKHPKIASLVYEFEEELASGGCLCGPVPDYLAWMDKVLFVDLCTCSDNYNDSGLSEEERTAWRIFHYSIEATSRLIELYKQDKAVFRKVARGLSFLPCLMSWHPDAAGFNRRFLKLSDSGEESLCGDLRHNATHLARQSWPVRYAYAIVFTINLTIDCHRDKLPLWAEIYGYGVRHEIDPAEIEESLAKMNCSEEKKNELRYEWKGACRMLPKWTKELTKIQQPITPRNVLSYWRIGKEMILEEMPDFHLRPEWKKYRDGRKYANGAKKGAVQHAIFKDILVALKTMAAMKKRHSTRPATVYDEPP
jgi:hypothetical protein